VNLRAVLAVAVMGVCMSTMAHAGDMISVGGGAYHFDRDKDFNETNYGLGYERDWNKDLTWSVGVYKNSIRRATFYGLLNYYPFDLGAGFRAGVSGGLMSGYHHSAIIGAAMPTLEWRGDYVSVQAYVIPTISPYIDGAAVLQLKFVLDKTHPGDKPAPTSDTPEK
jgi:hypothetical protein